MVTWAVGHLVQLAEPDAYDAKFKSWKMADLPIVPPRFKLVVRDERSRKQMSVITKQLGRDDIDEVVNACDAGREGELIFAYLYEQAKGKKPVKRLWLNSMTNAAMKSALRGAAAGTGVREPRGGGPLALGGRLDRRHERHPGGHHPPAQQLRRRRLAGPRPDPHAGDRGPPRGGDQGLQARALLARGRHLRGRSPERRRRCRGRRQRCRGGRARLPRPVPRPRSGTKSWRAARGSPARSSPMRSCVPAAGARGRSPSSRRKSSARKRRCSTT